MVYGGETDDGADDSLWSFNTTSLLWNKVTCPEEAFKAEDTRKLAPTLSVTAQKFLHDTFEERALFIAIFFLPSISAPWIKITSFLIYCVGLRCT